MHNNKLYKKTIVAVIFEKGKKEDPGNYRLVSPTSSLRKVECCQQFEEGDSCTLLSTGEFWIQFLAPQHK